MDEYGKIKHDIVHLTKIALSGRGQDIFIFVRKLARKYRSDDTALSEELMGLLRQTPVRGDPVRKVEVATLPVDSDTRLPLIRVTEFPVLEIEPIYDKNTRNELEQLIQEQAEANRLRSAGIDPTRTVLFTGPPGVGKTYGAKWIARELKRPLVTLDLSAVMSSFLGRTGNNVRVVLDYAKERDCVLLLDELDAVAKRRDDSTEIGELKRLVTVLLQEIDEWPSTGLLIAATNHSDLLDNAVWRRFESVVRFELPNEIHLGAICQELLDLPSDSAWIKILGITMKGLSFSDAAQHVRRARRMAVLNGGDVIELLEQIVRERINELDRNDKQSLAVLLNQTEISQRQASRLTGVSRDTIRKRKHDVLEA
jgi:SpoVK/Ycf46/Vps4 family AAA+-type ATPase